MDSANLTAKFIKVFTHTLNYRRLFLPHHTHIMNRTLSILAGFALLGALSFAGCSPSGKTEHTKSTVAAPAGGMRLAYVDIDSFEAQYVSLKKKKDEFKQQQQAMESELERSAQQMQADYTAVMRKQQAGTLTQSEGEAAEKRITQMQQSLETRRAAMTAQFQEKLESFNNDLHSDLDAFLTDYTKEHNFDYVLSYSRNNAQILYANKGLNITEDVIKGMNERAGKGSSSKDTAKAN